MVSTGTCIDTLTKTPDQFMFLPQTKTFDIVGTRDVSGADPANSTMLYPYYKRDSYVVNKDAGTYTLCVTGWSGKKYPVHKVVISG